MQRIYLLAIISLIFFMNMALAEPKPDAVVEKIIIPTIKFDNDVNLIFNEREVDIIKKSAIRRFSERNEASIAINIAAASDVKQASLDNIKNYEYENWKREYNQYVYHKQGLYSNVIFILIIGMIIISIGLTCYQFFVNVKLAMNKNENFSTIETEITANGLKVKTQIVGLILLAFSFSYFYLLVDRVYPITTTTAVHKK